MTFFINFEINRFHGDRSVVGVNYILQFNLLFPRYNSDINGLNNNKMDILNLVSFRSLLQSQMNSARWSCYQTFRFTSLSAAYGTRSRDVCVFSRVNYSYFTRSIFYYYWSATFVTPFFSRCSCLYRYVAHLWTFTIRRTGNGRIRA